MLYSDQDIERALREGTVVIDGLVPGSIQPASVDFHLSDRPFKVWIGWVANSPFPSAGAALSPPITPWEDQSHEMEEVAFRDGTITLSPGAFALASTTERVKIGHRVAGRLEGKSSLARLGLIVHTTAGFFDPGFEGYPTLELLNVSPRPMLLRPDMPIAQMCFFEVMSKPKHLYGERGKYDQQGADPEPSHYFENFQEATDG